MNSDAFLRTVFDSFDMGYRRASRGPMSVMPLYRSYRADTGEGSYPVFGDVFDAEEFRGTVDFVRLREYDQTLKNKSWGPPGIEYDRTDVERDRIGGLADRMQRQVESLMRVPTLQVLRAIQDACLRTSSSEAYDGDEFFGPDRGGNVVTGAYWHATDAEARALGIADAWQDAGDRMMGLTTDTGRIINVMPDTILCHPRRKAEWQKLARAMAPPSAPNERVPNAEGEGLMRVLAPKHWTVRDGATWAGLTATQVDNLISTGQTDPGATSAERIAIAMYTGDSVLKPFVWQYETLARSEGRPTGERIVGGRYRCEVDTTQLVRTRKYAIACETRGIAGYGLPQYAVLMLSSV